MIKGLDVSSYQEDGGIDFEKVKEAGYDFVVIKVTEGVGYTNPFYHRDTHAARGAELPVLAYTYFHPEQDAVAQANKVHESLARNAPPVAVVIDIEEHPATQEPRQVHERLDQMRTVLRQHGYRTVTYSYASFLEGVVPASCKFCGSDPLWVANYQEQPKPFAPWHKVTIWQNSQTGHVPGIDGAVDLDEYEGDKQAWQDFLDGKTRTVQPDKSPDWYHRLLEFPPSKLRDPGKTEKHAGHTYQVGEDVDTIQRKLSMKPSGRYDPTTANHVKGFQKTHGLHVDGIVGPATARKIEEK